MGRRKENIPKNIRRYTVQMDASLYRAIRMSALFLNIKTYELMNRVLVLGLGIWGKVVKDKNAKINVKGPTLVNARDLMRKIRHTEKK